VSDTLDRLFSLETFGIKLGLENITRCATALGHPSGSFASLHIAGHQRQGIGHAHAHAALVASGRARRPLHLAAPRRPQRALRHRREPVDDAALEACAATCSTARTGCTPRHPAVRPTFFEATTAVGFELFRRPDVEVAVIEVGWAAASTPPTSSTPVASRSRPSASIISSILGSTLGEIAFEKAGIIKPGRRCPGAARTRRWRRRARRPTNGAHALEWHDQHARVTHA
jgi:dihydrofolate synthase/folylpolyglutamate synthase